MAYHYYSSTASLPLSLYGWVLPFLFVNFLQVLKHLIMCFAGCLFILHNFVGAELTSHVIEKSVQRYTY